MLRPINLSKSYHSELLFDGVNFTLGAGDRVGLVGPNGTGKSTLLRILVGIEAPTGGRVEVGPGTTIGFLPQQVFDPDSTVGDLLKRAELDELSDRMRQLEVELATGNPKTIREYGEAQNRWIDLRGWMREANVTEVRQRLDISHLAEDQPLVHLSGGEQARVMLASLLLAEPTLLILDEPTNHLDRDGIEWLADYLRTFAGGVMVVTHDRAFLDRVVTRIYELDGIHEQLQAYQGGYSEYRCEKTPSWESLLLAYEAQEKHRRQLAEDIERTKDQARSVEASTRNDKVRRYAKKVARKAISRERRLMREMQSAQWLAAPQERPELTLAFGRSFDSEQPTAEPVIEARGLSVEVDGRKLLDDTDLTILRGERIMLSGKNGAGKTTLLRTLAGEAEAARGSVGRGATIALLPQTHDDLRTGQTVIDYFRSRVAMYEEDAEEFLQSYLFDLDEQRQSLRSLSAGELRRLLLAMMVNSGADVLFLDEPTNYLDFDSLDVVEEALSQYAGTVVMVTHDDRFAEKVGYGRHLVLTGRTISEAD